MRGLIVKYFSFYEFVPLPDDGHINWLKDVRNITTT